LDNKSLSTEAEKGFLKKWQKGVIYLGNIKKFYVTNVCKPWKEVETKVERTWSNGPCFKPELSSRLCGPLHILKHHSNNRSDLWLYGSWIWSEE
jgi:hypothetical protein